MARRRDSYKRIRSENRRQFVSGMTHRNDQNVDDSWRESASRGTTNYLRSGQLQQRCTSWSHTPLYPRYHVSSDNREHARLSNTVRRIIYGHISIRSFRLLRRFFIVRITQIESN